MERQINLIKKFVAGANYYMVRYPTKTEEELGKILKNDELININLKDNEVHMSIEYTNGDKLLVIDLKPMNARLLESQIQLMHRTLEDAKAIELVYPEIFTWVFNGLNIVGYAIVPSGQPKSHSTITRYGGTENFIKILRQHLKNIVKMKKGSTPDYNFLDITDTVNSTELALGSINRKTDLYSVPINIKDSVTTVLGKAAACEYDDFMLHRLEMKYWSKEINPDFIDEAKHIKLKNALPLTDDIYNIYPLPIKRLMELKTKGNYNRFLLSRFLLAVHSPKDAKFIYYSVLGDEELNHVKTGDCSTQWNYVKNNLKRYDCPTMRELAYFVRDGDEPMTHPLEKIHEYMEKQNGPDEG